ncbi:helix-turn-helix domain-containing protein [Serpentinicella sp. ANB-PHB4]|uniref:helix-turn-helix domain-containing protein n=1 Tax=Serpentinicella sp. ANB-PHB4 TaxID=3074076 RepID=UPI00285AF41C|nr:helix-turn-helix domain-containing protein [Serpentinicella sp. ANB-PHB4]MDR5659059.1 helix-turn-helix domain-containing protein [Serpentinicella sp. ANB-PHB4]
MNRVAETIKQARQKAKMTEKELAKKCGLSANYIIQIESGKKVINEKIAENILKKLGASSALTFQDEIKEDTPSENKRKKDNSKSNINELYSVEPNEQWSDALANIIKRFPVYDLVSDKIVKYKELPVLGKKVDGYQWDKIIFIQSSSNEMEQFRINKNDIVMVYKTKEIHNNRIYLIELDQKKMIRQLRKEANRKVALSRQVKNDHTVRGIDEIKVIGECIKVEFELVNK